MAFPKRQILSVQTDGAGDLEVFINALNGKIESVEYIADGSNPFAATADFTITLERTGVVVWAELGVAASKTVRPRQRINNPEGVLQPELDHIIVGGGVGSEFDRLKIVVANGGANKDGQFSVLMF